MKNAIVIGATGATGTQLVQQLLEHQNYQSVTVLTRRSLSIDSSKLIEHLVDFSKPKQWQDLVVGDELFSALGTTLKKAGSKAAQYEVDVTYQLNVARAAANNRVAKLILISSPNAKARARNFYLRIKGELDEQVRKLDFQHCILIKPSLIVGERADSRPAEQLAASVLKSSCSWLPWLHSYRPITAAQLATAMINIANLELVAKDVEFELEELFGVLE